MAGISTGASGVLESRYRLWRRERLAALGVEGAARSAAVWGGLWLALSFVDSVVPLPSTARWLAWLSLCAAAAVGLLRFVALPLWRTGPREILRGVCGRFPALAPYLLSAWELDRGPGARHVSAELARAHVEETERLLAELAPGPAFSARPSKTATRLLATGLAAWAAAAPWLYWSRTDPLRLLMPWNAPALEELVEISPGSVRLPWGSGSAIAARWRRPSSEGRLDLWLRSSGSGWTKTAWDQGGAGGFSYNVSNLVRPLQYQLRWKDLRSGTYRLDPAPYPRLAELEARIHPPGASPGSAQAQRVAFQDAGGLSVVRGSWIVVSGKASEPLARARLAASFLPAPMDLREARPQGSGRLEAGFVASEDGEFHFDLASPDGLSDPRPARFELKAVADAPPSAEILSPAFDVEVSNREPLALTYEVRDDYGVASVELAMRAAGGAETRLAVARFSKPVADSVGDFRWDLSGMPVGREIEFWLRATDASAMSPQTGLSGKRRLKIVDFESAHADMERLWMEAEKRLARLEEKEAAARRLLETLAKGRDSKAEGSWRELERALGPSWAEAASSLLETAQASSQDPYANPGLSEQLGGLAEEFEAVRAETLPRASSEASKKDWSAAARSHGALEREARKARELMAAGHGLQAMQDLWSQAERMDQQGLDLSNAAAKAAESGRLSDRERGELRAALERIESEMKALARTIQSMPKPPEGSAEERRRKTVVVPLGSAMAKADALRRALDSGDYKEAARLAQSLSEELARVRQALAEAATAGGGEGGGAESRSPVSAEMDALLGLWQQVVEGQARSVGLAQKVDEERLKAALEKQRELLGRLEKRQRDLLERALRLGPAVPGDVEVLMRTALGEFVRREVAKAPQLLAQAAARLSTLAQLSRPPLAASLAELEKEQRAILEELRKEESPPSMSAAQAAQAAGARAAQAKVRGQTAELGGRLEEVSRRTSAIPPKAVASVGEAQEEQRGAERSLERRDASSALAHEEKALELLDAGMKELASATERQRKIERAMQSPFSSPRGGARPMRAGEAAKTGFVPLPSARDYQPTPDIRKELEKSVQEPRPRAYDQVIKDYFKRISE